MGYAVRTLTAPTDLPVDVNEVKSALRIDIDDEDPMLLQFLLAAISDIEAGSGRLLMTQAKTLVIDAFPGSSQRLYTLETPGGGSMPILLPFAPVTAVTALRYVDINAPDPTVFTVWGAGNYLLDKDSEPARLTPMYPNFYPITYPRMGAVEIDVSGGYANRDVIPPGLKMAIYLLTGEYYDHRSAIAEGQVVPIPDGVQHLIWNDKVHWPDDDGPIGGP